jgi:1,4-dihydroxy-2-naphthoyl-CoA hydrolase
MFTYRTTVKLHDTDAAGVMFFGNQFHLAHDCYEAMMAHVGCSLVSIISSEAYLVLIVKAEGEYKKPLTAEEPVELRLTVEKIGKSSYTVFQEIRNAAGELTGTVRTVHVSVDRSTKRTCPLPERLRAALGSL